MLALVGRNKSGFERLMKKFKAFHLRNKPLIMFKNDVGAESVISETINTYGHLDVLINSSGAGTVGSIEDLNMEDFDKVMSRNLRDVVEIVKCAVPYLSVTKGTIVNVSSSCSTRPFEGFLAYCMSKACLDQFTKCAAVELKDLGISINSVNPGFSIGDFMSSPLDDDSEIENNPIRDHIKKCVNAIVFFATFQHESFVSGAVLPVPDAGVINVITL